MESETANESTVRADIDHGPVSGYNSQMKHTVRVQIYTGAEKDEQPFCVLSYGISKGPET